MRIQRWWFRVGFACGLPMWLNGHRYPPVLACVDQGEVWIGVGACVTMGPISFWYMHLNYRATGFEERDGDS